MKNNKILFVDDESNILNAISRSIMDEGFEALYATSGEKALEYFKENMISVIVSDMKMPNMSGLDLLKKVKEISPNTVRIVLSGYNQLPQILATVNSVGVFRYITKPWNDDDEFLPTIREALDYYNLAAISEELKAKLISKNRLYEKSIEINKGLISQMSQSISNIKTVSKFMLKLQNTYIENLKQNYSEIKNASSYNEILGNLYISYLNKSMSDKEVFTLSRLKDELMLCKANFNLDNPEFVFTAEYKSIKFILEESINFIVNEFSLNQVQVNIVSAPKLHAEIIYNNMDFYHAYITNIKMKLFFSMIDQILITIGGGVNLYADETYLINLNFAVKIG